MGTWNMPNDNSVVIGCRNEEHAARGAFLPEVRYCLVVTVETYALAKSPDPQVRHAKTTTTNSCQAMDFLDSRV